MFPPTARTQRWGQQPAMRTGPAYATPYNIQLAQQRAARMNVPRHPGMGQPRQPYNQGPQSARGGAGQYGAAAAAQYGASSSQQPTGQPAAVAAAQQQAAQRGYSMQQQAAAAAAAAQQRPAAAGGAAGPYRYTPTARNEPSQSAAGGPGGDQGGSAAAGAGAGGQGQPAAVRVGNQAPLTSERLAAANPSDQKQMLGERLFPLIHGGYPELAGKITGNRLYLEFLIRSILFSKACCLRWIILICCTCWMRLSCLIVRWKRLSAC